MYACAIAPDGTRALSGSSDKTLILWDLHSGQAGPGPYAGRSWPRRDPGRREKEHKEGTPHDLDACLQFCRADPECR